MAVIYLTAAVKRKFDVPCNTPYYKAFWPSLLGGGASEFQVKGALKAGAMKVMYYRRILSLMGSLLLMFAILGVGYSKPVTKPDNEALRRTQTIEPINLAILIQDDLISQVSNEIGVTKDFIRSLPAGSSVMVSYITSGSLQVRQPFTTDLNKAAGSLRIPTASTSSSPFNPYVEVLEALKKFESEAKKANVILLISDGLDISRGFDATAAGQTIDLERVIKEANRRRVAVYSFYAPSVGLTSRSNLAASYGQSSLKRLGDDTGGKAFFQGVNGFVTFDSYFTRLREELARAY